MIKPLAIYEVKRWYVKLRLIATGKRKGLLHEFLDCRDLKRDCLYYPEPDVKLLYDGNSSCPSIEDK